MAIFFAAVLWDHLSSPSQLGEGKVNLWEREQSGSATMVPVEGGYEVGEGEHSRVVIRSGDKK